MEEYIDRDEGAVKSREEAIEVMKNLKKVVLAIYSDKIDGKFVVSSKKEYKETAFESFIREFNDGIGNFFSSKYKNIESEKGENVPLSAVRKYLEKNGVNVDEMRVLSPGSRALTFFSEGEGFGNVVRMSIANDAREPDRPDILEMLGANISSVRDAAKENKDGADFLEGLKVEVVPLVPTWDDVKKKAEEMNVELHFSKFYSIVMDNVGENVFDNDKLEAGNWGFVLDKKGNVVPLAFDPGSLFFADRNAEELPKKVKKGIEAKEEFGANGLAKGLIDYPSFGEEFKESGINGGFNHVKGARAVSNFLAQGGNTGK